MVINVDVEGRVSNLALIIANSILICTLDFLFNISEIIKNIIKIIYLFNFKKLYENCLYNLCI